MQYQEVYTRLEQYGQTHLLQYYDNLSPEQQTALLQQIADMDFSVLDRSTQEEQPKGKLEPLGACTISEIAEKQAEYRKIGLDAIRSGSVGAVLLAGGQGSRLGCSGPKGVFQIGVNNDLTIFECLFRNLMAVTAEAGVAVPLFIMTSETNDAETKAFLEQKQFFGYPRESVHFFVQEMAPVVDANGKRTKRLEKNILFTSSQLSSINASKVLKNSNVDISKSSICVLLKKNAIDC